MKVQLSLEISKLQGYRTVIDINQFRQTR